MKQSVPDSNNIQCAITTRLKYLQCQFSFEEWPTHKIFCKNLGIIKVSHKTGPTFRVKNVLFIDFYATLQAYKRSETFHHYIYRSVYGIHTNDDFISAYKTYSKYKYMLYNDDEYNVSSSIYDEECGNGCCIHPFSQLSAVPHDAPSETQPVISRLFQCIH